MSCLFRISFRTGASFKTQAWSKLPKKYRYTWDLTDIYLLLLTEIKKLWRSINTGNNPCIYASLVFMGTYFPTYQRNPSINLYFTVDISKKLPQAVTLKILACSPSIYIYIYLYTYIPVCVYTRTCLQALAHETINWSLSLQFFMNKSINKWHTQGLVFFPK